MTVSIPAHPPPPSTINIPAVSLSIHGPRWDGPEHVPYLVIIIFASRHMGSLWILSGWKADDGRAKYKPPNRCLFNFIWYGNKTLLNKENNRLNGSNFDTGKLWFPPIEGHSYCFRTSNLIHSNANKKVWNAIAAKMSELICIQKSNDDREDT